MKLMSFDHESFLAFSLKPQMDANIYRFHIFLTPPNQSANQSLTHSPKHIYPWRWSYVHLTNDMNEKSTSNLNIYSTTKTIYIQIQIACVLEWSEFLTLFPTIIYMQFSSIKTYFRMFLAIGGPCSSCRQNHVGKMQGNIGFNILMSFISM